MFHFANVLQILSGLSDLYNLGKLHLELITTVDVSRTR